MVELSRHFFSNLERFQPHAFLSLRSLGECSEASLCRSFAAERSMQAVVAVWPLLSSRKPPCTRCSRQEAVAKSTAMEGSHIKLRKRLVAVCLVTDDAYLGKGGPASRLRNRRDPARRRRGKGARRRVKAKLDLPTGDLCERAKKPRAKNLLPLMPQIVLLETAA